MNYCPHCGKPLRGCDSSFCEGCKERPNKEIKKDVPRMSVKGKKKKKNNTEHKKQVKVKENTGVPKVSDDGYDGYYDDIRPEDENEVRQGIDKDIMKRIAGIIASVMIIICCCIGIMYLI